MRENKYNIPILTEDIYWGKIPERELINIIELIEDKGFSSFDKVMQKKLDFTYDDDRADWRFYIPLNRDSKVLDIGAGLGRISIPLARVVNKVVSCDHSLSRMRFLKKRAEAEGLSDKIDVMVADVYNLPFEENSFDLIVMNGVLEWVGLTKIYSSPIEAQIKSLEICRKLLKKGGHLYIGIENRFALVYLRATDHGGLMYTSYMPRFLANIYYKIRGRGEYRTYTYSKKGYENLIHRSGFENKANFYLLYPGYNLPRIIIPYNSLHILKYAINSFRKSNNVLNRIILYLTNFNILLKIYRFVFFSFGIIIKK